MKPGPAASVPTGARPETILSRFRKRPGFIGWVVVVAVWMLAFAAALVYILTTSESLRGLPAVALVGAVLPLLGLFFGLWVILTSGAPGPIRRVIGYAIPWMALLSPLGLMHR